MMQSKPLKTTSDLAMFEKNRPGAQQMHFTNELQECCSGWIRLIIVGLAFTPSACHAEGSRKVMRLLISNADLVILGEVESVSNGLVRQANTLVQWRCRIRVVEVLGGKVPNANLISANIDILTETHYAPNRGDKRVFFLKQVGRVDGSDYETSDLYFGVQPAIMSEPLRHVAREASNK